MRARRRVIEAKWAVVFAALGFAESGGAQAAGPDYVKEVRPILERSCYSCHGPEKQKNGYRLDVRDIAIKGGDSGEAAVVPHDAKRSPLIRYVSGEDEEMLMPPKKSDKPRLTAAEVETLRAWIDAGPAWPEEFAGGKSERPHWSLQPLVKPAVPSAEGNPIDAFIRAKLAEKKLAPSPEADARTLIRRTTLDLTGLPPEPEDVEAFVAESGRAPQSAFSALVDRLLASPQFGERWGRHWLDGAGWTDVLSTDNDVGCESPLAENKWRYRDYVVRAFNDDKPFDRFVTEQLAGDEMVDWRSAAEFTPETAELLIATGMMRIASDETTANELNTPNTRHSVLQRTMETVAGNLLALTIQCAKCHDHKYEPVSQRDYYRVIALFQPAFNPDQWLQPKQRQLPVLSPAQKAAAEKINAELDAQAVQVQGLVDAVRAPCVERLKTAQLATLPEAIREDARKAVDTPAPQRTEVQKYLAEKFEKIILPKPEQVTAALNDAEKLASAPHEKRLAELRGQRRTWEHWQVVYDVAAPTPTRVLRRGNHETPGDEVAPGFPAVLCPAGAEACSGPSQAAGATSGRRLALARWLTAPGTPANNLLLRVRVNRIWQQLFGRGLVATADNLGVSGAKPSHPELLDWLAAEFSSEGQRLKPFLKMLLTSATYRQAAAGAGTADPDNVFCGRMRPRRLESEAIRDSILAVSGRLDRAMGGPPVPVTQQSDGAFAVQENHPGSSRRSLYLLARRNYHPTVLGVFDQPNLAMNCVRRDSSAVVLQSLTMLNDRFVLEQADYFATRVASAAGPEATPAQLVEKAFAIAIARPPVEDETARCTELLRRHTERFTTAGKAPADVAREALTHLCQVLLNSSEFLYTP